MPRRAASYRHQPQGRSGFGRAPLVTAFKHVSASTQEQALQILAQQTAPDCSNPVLRRVAAQIIRNCDARDDKCELRALFHAVKYGDKTIDGLESGIKYLADNADVDTFIAPSDMLNDCISGACIGDCDDHAAFVAALAANIGFRVGLRAWGAKGSGGYQHVYAVALFPKEESDSDTPTEYGLDTSADAGDEDEDGWQPPAGEVATVWITQS